MNGPVAIPRIDADTLRTLHGRSLLVTRDWQTAELDTLLAVAARFEVLDRARHSTALLPDELAYALFFDNSTRTKSAWAGAAARLGMRPVIVDGSSTQVEHGETAQETGAMLGMNAHALGVRHDLILGEGNRVHAGGEAGHRRLPGRDQRFAHRARRQPAVRRGPPDADAGRPDVAARALPGGPRGPEDRRELGLFAELRQAALGAAGAGRCC